MNTDVEEPILSERERLPDGTASGPERGPWPKWHVAAFSDKVAGLHVAAAIILSASALFIGPLPRGGLRVGFPLFAPFAAALFFVALLAMFLVRDRHGLVRALLALGAAFLAITALWLGRQVPTAPLLVAYWIPAILGITAALILSWGHRMAHDIEVDFQDWRRQQASR